MSMKIPLSLACAVRASSASKDAGLLYATHKAGGEEFKALLVQWDGTPFAIYVDGQRPFRFYQMKAGVSLRGLLIKEPEITVDPDSRYNSMQAFDPLGALVLRGGIAHVAASPLGESFDESTEVPLWGKFENGTEEEAVGFLRWGLAVRDGERLVEVWSQEVEDPD